jgi:hypothetical protein
MKNKTYQEISPIHDGEMRTNGFDKYRKYY